MGSQGTLRLSRIEVVPCLSMDTGACSFIGVIRLLGYLASDAERIFGDLHDEVKFRTISLNIVYIY